MLESDSWRKIASSKKYKRLSKTLTQSDNARTNDQLIRPQWNKNNTMEKLPALSYGGIHLTPSILCKRRIWKY